MKRLFWVALGATAGVMVARKVTTTADRIATAAESLTPAGLGESMAEGIGVLGQAIRGLGEDVRAAVINPQETPAGPPGRAETVSGTGGTGIGGRATGGTGAGAVDTDGRGNGVGPPRRAKG